MVCGGTTVKSLVLVAVPATVVTAMGPEAAPVGTVTKIVVAESTVNVVSAPANLTAAAWLKHVRGVVSGCPTGPESGVRPLIAGAATTVKLVLLVADPPVVVAVIAPVAAVAGTFSDYSVAESILNVATAAPKT